MVDVTRDEIVTRTYQLLWESSDVEEYDETTIVVPKVNSVVDRICKWHVVSVIDKRKYRAWYLPFLDKDAFYTYVQPKSNTAAIATTDTEITIDPTNYLDATAENPQYLLINWDIIQYTGKSATQFTWVTGIDVAHAEWLSAYQLYKVPSSISKPYTLWRQINTEAREEVDHVDNRKTVYYNRYYMVMRDGSQDLIHIAWFTWNDVFKLDYISLATTMSEGSSVCTIPDCEELVSHIAAWELLRENEEYEDWQTKLEQWYAFLDEMYSFYAKQTDKKETRIKAWRKLWFNYAYPQYGARTRYSIR